MSMSDADHVSKGARSRLVALTCSRGRDEGAIGILSRRHRLSPRVMLAMCV